MPEKIEQQIEVIDSPAYVALIPAAGVGARMGAATPKQYLKIDNKTILQHTVEAFLNFPLIRHVYVVVSAEDAWANELPGNARLSVLRCGGATRRDTVSHGLAAISDQVFAGDWVLVHDAARPGLHAGLLARLINEVADHPVGGLLALSVVDTVKQQVAGNVRTIPRDGLWLAQTPQMFRYRLLRDALLAAEQVTDEASAIEAAGYTPLLVEGHACNLKVTLPADLALATLFLRNREDV